jgi:integrase
MKNSFDRSNRNPTIDEIYENQISSRNKEMIQQVMTYKKGYITEKAALKIRWHLTKFAYVLETDFDKATKEEITKVGGLLLQADFSTKTKQDIIGSVKCAYKLWCGENEYYPKQVAGLKRPSSRTSLKLPEEMLSEEQIYDMIKACGNVRDKFYLALCGLDGALRPIEAQNIKWGDIKKDKYGYFITVFTAKKSGNKETRTIRLIKSEPYYIQWTHEYPGEKQDEKYVFVNFVNRKRVDKATIRGLFKRLKKKVRYKGRLYPYLLRHSLITKMSKDPRIPIAVLKKFVGHSLRSNTISEYQHIGDDDLKDMQLEINGITKSNEDKPREFKPIDCPHCNKRNEFDAEFCLLCNQALSQKRMIDESDKLKSLKEELQSMKEKQLSQEVELEKRRKFDGILDKLLASPQILEMVANQN